MALLGEFFVMQECVAVGEEGCVEGVDVCRGFVLSSGGE